MPFLATEMRGTCRGQSAGVMRLKRCVDAREGELANCQLAILDARGERGEPGRRSRRHCTRSSRPGDGEIGAVQDELARIHSTAEKWPQRDAKTQRADVHGDTIIATDGNIRRDQRWLRQQSERDWAVDADRTIQSRRGERGKLAAIASPIEPLRHLPHGKRPDCDEYEETNAELKCATHVSEARRSRRRQASR